MDTAFGRSESDESTSRSSFPDFRGFHRPSCPTQAVLSLVGLAAVKVIRDRYKPPD
ncbi:MAG: hypothetical protein R6U98_05515 [Pirellulaceae bacterium]